MKLTKRRGTALVGYSEPQKENIMKRKDTMIGMALVAFAAVAGFAQTSQPDRVVVPLTDPAKPAFVEVHILMGSIKVTGYEGKEVIVEATVREKAVTRVREGVFIEPPEPPEPAVIPEHAEREFRRQLARTAGEDEDKDKEERADKAKAAGLKQIPLASSGLTVEEDNNRVAVEIESFRRAYDLVIKVPAGSSLKLEAGGMGDIRVENVSGEVEVENMNGSVSLQNVSGTVLVSTANGDIEAVLARVAADKPMSFATFNGDIDVALPPDAKATLGLKSHEGDVYSDFDITLKTTPQRVEEGGRHTGRFRVSIERAAVAAINGGGVEMKFETSNGNIYIRKKK
jgi:hypothetical protein